MLKLYDYFRSSASYRVRIALNLKQLNFEAVPIHLVKNGGEQFSTNYTKVNPQNLVPALQDEQKFLTQSLAIMEYLEDIHPTPAILPKDPYQRALVRAFSLAIIADIHPLNNLRVLNYLTQDLKLSEDNKLQWYRHWVEKGLSALEKLLPFSMQTFCFGETPSLADICLVPQMYNARRFQCDLTACPNLVRIDKNCQQHQAFIEAQPETVT